MRGRYSDEELSGMLHDYLTNNLDPSGRAEVVAYLARSSQAAIDLENLQLIMEELQRQENSAPPAAIPGLVQFLAHAKSHPLHRREKKQASWLAQLAASMQLWGRPAFAIAMMVIVGQSVIIANLATPGIEHENVPRITRSLAQDSVNGRKRGSILNLEVIPNASFAALMAVLREVDGTVVFVNGEGNILYVELATSSAKDAIARLRKSKLVLSVIEIPPLDPG